MSIVYDILHSKKYDCEYKYYDTYDNGKKQNYIFTHAFKNASPNIFYQYGAYINHFSGKPRENSCSAWEGF